METTVIITALGSGLMAGFFFSFSICIMKALSDTPAAQAIATMKSINIVVLNPWFLIPFFGLSAISLILIVMALLHWEESGSRYIFAGGLSYLIGTFLVTIIFNVPRNNQLADVDDASTDANELWAIYLVGWTRWNHVRTIAALAGATFLTIALTHI
ncbi:DUF1772 domain-containing protein [bacterium AH-315-F18]|nr:DUF1772 domain-containing protein [bacterium AH-315-F18]